MSVVIIVKDSLATILAQPNGGDNSVGTWKLTTKDINANTVIEVVEADKTFRETLTDEQLGLLPEEASE